MPSVTELRADGATIHQVKSTPPEVYGPNSEFDAYHEGSGWQYGDFQQGGSHFGVALEDEDDDTYAQLQHTINGSEGVVDGLSWVATKFGDGFDPVDFNTQTVSDIVLHCRISSDSEGTIVNGQLILHAVDDWDIYGDEDGVTPDDGALVLGNPTWDPQIAAPEWQATSIYDALFDYSAICQSLIDGVNTLTFLGINDSTFGTSTFAIYEMYLEVIYDPSEVVVGIIPPLRIVGRSDGLTSGAARVYGGGNTVQSGSRTFGAIL